MRSRLESEAWKVGVLVAMTWWNVEDPAARNEALNRRHDQFRDLCAQVRPGDRGPLEAAYEAGFDQEHGRRLARWKEVAA